jgi:hypothetical protein
LRSSRRGLLALSDVRHGAHIFEVA